jgi:hypothetical protein
MATQRRQESKRGTQRQRKSVLQRSKPRKAGVESTATGGGKQAGLVLCPDGRHEEKADQRKDGQRPEQPNQQIIESVEVLTMTESDITTARELATHAANIKHLQDDMDKLVQDVNDIKAALVEIQKTLSEAKGGWRMLMMISGVSGTVGAALTQLAHYLSGK